MSYRRFATLVLLLASVLDCAGAQEQARPEPFAFSFTSVGTSDRGHLIEAAVAPEGKTVPATFRLWFAPPGLATRPGETIRAVLRRGEPSGMGYVLIMLAPTFYDLPPSSEGSGALTAIDVKVEPADALPLVLRVRSSSSPDHWLAEARLVNGGRFSVALDNRTKRGEFRRVDRTGDTRVFGALFGLLSPR